MGRDTGKRVARGLTGLLAVIAALGVSYASVQADAKPSASRNVHLNKLHQVAPHTLED